MKKPISSKCLLAIFIFLVILCLFIFHITCNPELENNWDAISACATWVGVLVSGLAIYYAIRVPQEIAKSQNDIALFDKRFECYNMIQTFLVCAKQLETADTNIIVQVAFRIYIDQPENIPKNLTPIDIVAQLKQKYTANLLSGEFLFSNYNVDMLQNIVNNAIDLIVEVSNIKPEQIGENISDKAMQIKNEYCKMCQDFENKYIKFMESELDIKKHMR